MSRTMILALSTSRTLVLLHNNVKQIISLIKRSALRDVMSREESLFARHLLKGIKFACLPSAADLEINGPVAGVFLEQVCLSSIMHHAVFFDMDRYHRQAQLCRLFFFAPSNKH